MKTIEAIRDWDCGGPPAYRLELERHDIKQGEKFHVTGLPWGPFIIRYWTPRG